jgi:hypothetical protein
MPTWFMFVCSVATFIPVTHASDDSADAPTRAMQTRDGVTVRIEKITLERVLNGPGWLRKQYDFDWQKYVPKDFQSDSFRVVQVFMSVSGAAEGGASSSFELGKGVSRIDGIAEFAPSMWRRRLPDVEVDHAALGLIYWAVIEGDKSLEAIFPVKAKLKVTTEGDKKVEFTFTDIAL